VERRDGVIKFDLPTPLVDEPKLINNFLPEEMFLRVKNAVDKLKLGPNGTFQYHTMIGRWESSISFDKDIEEYCLMKAREIFNDQTLEKAYFFVSRYQIHDGCIPSLWEHYDQNGTQTTIDLTIENSANWDLRVERVDYKQEANSAIIFAGQQHMHARPPYPTLDSSLSTVVLFMHFTQPNHWIQTEKNAIYKYGSDGDIRYFNKNRYIPLPDSPVEQPVCPCHDYSNVLGTYTQMFGEFTDDEVEITELPMLSKGVLAPGIVEYLVPREASLTLDGLTRNVCFKLWNRAQVLGPDRKPTVNYNARSCYVRYLNNSAQTCHPHDPANRLYSSLQAGIEPIVNDFAKMYNILDLESHTWSLLRYERSDKFHNHTDDCAEFPRVVSVVMFLNDDFSGGELVFENHNLVIEPKAGKIVLFSSSFPFVHRVNPVLFGNRHTAITWYSYKNKKAYGE
jgi:hypothetical protein